MTLVVAFANENYQFMIGDSMLTTSEGIGNPGMPFPSDQAHLGPEPLRPVVGLTQKIVQLSAEMFLGWSGDLEVARRHLAYLADVLRGENVTYKDIERAQADYFKSRPTDSYALSTILLTKTSSEAVITVTTPHTRRVHPAIGEIVVIGSGTEQFLSYLEAVAVPDPPASGSNSPPHAQVIGYILDYLLQTMNHQSMTGFGLKEGWGGAFEVVVSKDGETLTKLDNILFQSYHWSLRNGDVKTFRQGRRYLQYYVGQDLVVLAQGKNEKLRAWIIPPPNRLFDHASYSLTRPVSPEMLCTFLLNIETQIARTHLLWREGGILITALRLSWTLESPSVLIPLLLSSL